MKECSISKTSEPSADTEELHCRSTMLCDFRPEDGVLCDKNCVETAFDGCAIDFGGCAVKFDERRGGERRSLGTLM